MLLNYEIPSHLLEKLEGKSTSEIEELITRGLEMALLQKNAFTGNNLKQEIMLNMLIEVADKIDTLSTMGVQVVENKPLPQAPKIVETPPAPVELNLDPNNPDSDEDFMNAFLEDIMA